MTDHTCKECIEFIDSYIEGDLEENVRDEFEKHLEKCPPCVDYVKSYERAVNSCKSIAKDEKFACCKIPDGVVSAILKAKNEQGE